MYSDEKLRQVTQNRKSWRQKPATMIGQVAAELLTRNIIPISEKREKIDEIWQRTVPEKLREHCSIEKVSNKQILVVVDSPSYAGQLRMKVRAIINAFRQDAPRTGITSVRIVIGNKKT